MNRLANKQALITGSSKGIGKGLARIFLREGAEVFLCARNEADLKACAKELAAEVEDASRVAYHAADVSDPQDAERLARAVGQRFSRLNVLINNASILGKRAPITEVDIPTDTNTEVSTQEELDRESDQVLGVTIEDVVELAERTFGGTWAEFVVRGR